MSSVGFAEINLGETYGRRAVPNAIQSHMPPTIRPAAPSDETGWRALWHDYCAFYQVAVPPSVTAATWARILDPASSINALVAVSEDETGALVGFAHYVSHPHTWSEKTLCYLEDLFVNPNARGAGVGHALIERLTTMGRENDWGRVYWHTGTDNAPARRLYDRFTLADNAVKYTVFL